MSEYSRRRLAWSCLFGGLGLVFSPALALAEAAIAFGQFNASWAVGTGFNYATQEQAQSFALTNCNARGPNCLIRGTFHNACGAVAVQDQGNGYSFAVRSDEKTARLSALTQCAKMGQACTIQIAICDTVSEAAITAQEKANEILREQEHQNFLNQWQACFNGSISNCNVALAYSNLVPTDRAKLLERRDGLAVAKEQERAQREQEAEDAQKQRESEAQAAADRAEKRAAEAEARAVESERRLRTTNSAQTDLSDRVLEFLPTPRQPTSLVLGTIVILFFATVARKIIMARTGKRDVLQEVAVETVVSLLTSPLLIYIGLVKEWTLLSVPVIGGFSLALVWSIASSQEYRHFSTYSI